jgi:hypothetical protein
MSKVDLVMIARKKNSQIFAIIIIIVLQHIALELETKIHARESCPGFSVWILSTKGHFSFLN